VSVQSARLEPDRTTLERCAWTGDQLSWQRQHRPTKIQVGIGYAGCTDTVEEADATFHVYDGDQLPTEVPGLLPSLRRTRNIVDSETCTSSSRVEVPRRALDLGLAGGGRRCTLLTSKIDTPRSGRRDQEAAIDEPLLQLGYPAASGSLRAPGAWSRSCRRCDARSSRGYTNRPEGCRR
jgi:hypothetical protein